MEVFFFNDPYPQKLQALMKSSLFHSECEDKFGKEQGKDVWEAVNSVFDVLPIAAVIDNKVIRLSCLLWSCLLSFYRWCCNVCILF